MLGRLLYFSNTRAEDRVTPIFLGGAIRRKYYEVEPLIKRGWLEVYTPAWSYTFNRDKIEDFIFFRCEVMCQKCEEKAQSIEVRLAAKYYQIQGKIPEGGDNSTRLKDVNSTIPLTAPDMQARARQIEGLLAESKRYMAVMTRFRKRAATLRSYRYALRFLLSRVKDIVCNARTPDATKSVRRKLIHLLGSCNLQTGEPLPSPDVRQGHILWEELKAFGLWHEYPPAHQYALTDVGVQLEEQLVFAKRQEKTPEEEEFDKLMRKIRL